MRKREICKYLGFVIVFLVEQLLVGVNFIDTMFTSALSLPFNSQIKSVAQSTVYFRTVIYAGAVPAILSYLIYRKGHYVVKIVHTGVGTLLYASWYMYLYFTCEIYMSDTLYPGVFTVFIAPYQIVGLVVLIVIYVSLYFYKRRKLKDNDQRNQANIRSC